MANTKPTPAQVKEEIAKLVDLKDKVPPRTFFGDDNRAAIEAQIAVLKGELNEDEIDGEVDHVASSAREALAWLNGENDSEEAPSLGWAHLVQVRATHPLTPPVTKKTLKPAKATKPKKSKKAVK